MSYKRKVLRALKRAQRRGEQLPGVGVVHVYHDGWCAHWRGAECDCCAKVKLGRRKPLPFPQEKTTQPGTTDAPGSHS